MTTVVCFKWVVAADDLRTDPATGAIDASRARNEISAYDRNTIEGARVLAAARGDRLVGLTAGAITAAGLKDALARGLDEAVHVPMGGQVPVDGHVTAQVLAAAIRTIDGADLVLTTEGSADSYAHETAPRVAELLGWPVVTDAVSVTVDEGRLRATRVLDDSVETVETTLPAVVSVAPEIAAAPVLGLTAVLGAAKKPRTELPLDDLGLDPDALTPRSVPTGVTGVRTARRGLRHEGTADEVTAAPTSCCSRRRPPDVRSLPGWPRGWVRRWSRRPPRSA